MSVIRIGRRRNDSGEQDVSERGRIKCYFWKVEANLERASSDMVFKRQLNIYDN